LAAAMDVVTSTHARQTLATLMDEVEAITPRW
jgi:hypothetical protein